MIHHIEAGTEPRDIPKDCELADMSGCWRNLSVTTIEGGKSLILKDNCKILVPKRERQNILNIAHKTHLGHESIITQLRGQVFWNRMTADVRQVATECDAYQRNHISISKEWVEVSHKSMFNLWPGKEVHMDFFKYNGNNFVFIVDRLTGYIHC